MNNLMRNFKVHFVAALFIVFSFEGSGKLPISFTSAHSVTHCEEAKILSGVSDGVTCNTYHQCFVDNRTPNTWIMKTFLCPPGGVWDRKYMVCVEGTSCENDGEESFPDYDDSGGVSSEPPETVTNPTDGPPLLTTPGPGPDTCPHPVGDCLNDPISTAPRSISAISGWSWDRTTLIFHGYEASKPKQVLPDGSAIRSSVATKWGKWGKWQYCPQGMYTIAFQYNGVLWKPDIYGIFFMIFGCQSPGGDENKLIESLAPDIERPSSAGKGQPKHKCTGAIVGFQFWIPPKRNGLEFSAERFAAICSIKAPEKKAPPSITGKPTDVAWTASKVCGKFQAMCGFRTQMEPRKAGHYPTGLHNMAIKCCHVEDPLKNCQPTEVRLPIRTCDNSKSAQGLRCEFQSRIGPSLDTDLEGKRILFYSGIGYDFPSIRDKLQEKIISILSSKASNLEYKWDDHSKVKCQVEERQTSSWETLCVNPGETVELYQIVGKCGYFLMRTNRFVKVVKGSGVEKFFEL